MFYSGWFFVHNTLKHRQAGVEIVCRQMRIAHGHLEGLMPQPGLHATKIDPAANETRSTGMS